MKTKSLTTRLTDFLTDFEKKKPTVLQSSIALNDVAYGLPKERWFPGGHLGIFWVGLCRPCCPGLQIGTPF